MDTKRRSFLGRALSLAVAGAFLAKRGWSAQQGGAQERDDPEMSYQLIPVGRVEKDDDSVRIRIFEDYAPALLGLEEWSHVNVFYWFDKNDVPQKRAVLQVHPRGDRKNPLTGVFACRAPVRPNLIALTVCRVLSVKDGVITIDAIDAFDQTPVLDIKPLIQGDEPREDLRVPDWVGKKK